MYKKVYLLTLFLMLIMTMVQAVHIKGIPNSSCKILPYARVKNYRSNSFQGYEPIQIKHAYEIDKINSTGKNQKIAIVVAYGSPTLEKDIKVFNERFNLPSTSMQY